MPRKAFVIQPKNQSPAEVEQAGLLEYLQGGRVMPTQSVEDYMEKLAVMARAVDARASAISNMPRQIESLKTGEVVATANFEAPELDKSGRALDEDDLPFELDLDDYLYRTEMGLCAYGATYGLIQHNRLTKATGKALGLRWLDPVITKPQITTIRPYTIEYYDYDNDRLEVEDVVRVWLPSLRELAPGKGYCQKVALSAGLVFNADSFVSQFFANGAMPVTIVMSDDDPDPQERNRIKAYLSNAMRGLLNAFNIEVLGSKMEFKQLTPPIKDLDLTPIAERNERSILVGMGVPLSIVLSGVGNYSASSDNDNLHFYEKSMNPEAGLIARKLNKQFFHPLGYHLRFRPDKLEVFQKQESSKVYTAVTLFKEDVIDVNELRQSGGFSALPPDELAKVEERRAKRLMQASPTGVSTRQRSDPDPEKNEREGTDPKMVRQGETADDDDAPKTKAELLRFIRETITPSPKAAEALRQAGGTVDPSLLRFERDEPEMFFPLPCTTPIRGALEVWGCAPTAEPSPPPTLTPVEQDELRKWRRKLTKAMRSGEPAADVPFTSDVLTDYQMSAIRYALRSAATPEAVGLVLESAVKVTREDNPSLQGIEGKAIREILAAFAEQLEAVQAVDGGASVDVIMGKVVAAVESRKQTLTAAVFTLVYQSVEAGMVNAVASIPAEMGVTVDWGLLSSEAQSFAQTYSFDLVTDLNATTQKGVRDALLKWIEEGGTMDDLADSIRPIFANEPATARIEAIFRTDRARMIAETEATRAYAQGKVDAWMKSGAAEFLPKEVPPAHVRCRCDISMVRQSDGSWWWRWDTANDDLVCPVCSPYIAAPLLNMARRAPQG